MSRGATTWTYTYDANGMRTRRTHSEIEYLYVYNGSQLTQLTVLETGGGALATNTLYFTYSADGTPLTVTSEGETYFYVTNIQGDVIAILDHAGRLVCRYVYDAWGNVTTYSDRYDLVVEHNPLRYRGYVYDWETGLYYLQSRYYSPEIGRFLNADALVSTGQGVLGNNMFAYCGNNPVNRIDATGKSFIGIACLIMMSIGIAIGLRADDPQTIKAEEARAKEKYKQELDEAKTVYNETTVSINGNLPEEQAKIQVSIIPDYMHNGKLDPLIQVKDSYAIKTKAEREAILDVIMASPEFNSTTFARGKDAWMAEWTGHNALYNLFHWTPFGINLAHVDFNEEEIIPWDLIW